MDFVASTSTSALDPYTPGRSAKFFSDELIIGGSTGVAHLVEGLSQPGATRNSDLDRNGMAPAGISIWIEMADGMDLDSASDELLLFCF